VGVGVLGGGGGVLGGGGGVLGFGGGVFCGEKQPPLTTQKKKEGGIRPELGDGLADGTGGGGRDRSAKAVWGEGGDGCTSLLKGKERNQRLDSRRSPKGDGSRLSR